MDTTTEHGIEAELVAKGLNAPRLTPAHIDATIAGETYHHFPGTTLTICVLTLFNGFTVVGQSAAASPENFDADVGRRIARADAREKIWPLAGYLLKTRLWEADQAFKASDKPAPSGGKLLDDLQELLIEGRDVVQVLAADMPMTDDLAIRVGQWQASVKALVGQG